MSRLDSAIRRLQAQRACIDHAAAAIADLSGPVLELGLGNGRTYDHLRSRLPDREIFVFEREVAAHPDCVPPPSCLILGDFAETLPKAAERFAAAVSLAHADVGSGDPAASRRSAGLVARFLPSMLRPGGLLLCELALEVPTLERLPMPEGIAAERYFYYRRPSA
ncbi:MAG: class I SAM-dependent methyltransferase [Kiloniellales bacterium]|nr:class I SAM-dependent methyltransferase [Kiloniellales bacterium]